MNNPLVIALDFDGTVCKCADYPAVGEPVPQALDWIYRFHLKAEVFLWTCREGRALELAVDYMEANCIRLLGVNSFNYWEGFETSRKLFANLYIDDAAIGVPLIKPPDNRAYLDWGLVGPEVLFRVQEGRLHA